MRAYLGLLILYFSFSLSSSSHATAVVCHFLPYAGGFHRDMEPQANSCGQFSRMHEVHCLDQDCLPLLSLGQGVSRSASLTNVRRDGTAKEV